MNVIFRLYYNMKSKCSLAFMIMLCSIAICNAGNVSCELASCTLRCELKDIRDVKDIVNELFDAGNAVYDNGIFTIGEIRMEIAPTAVINGAVDAEELISPGMKVYDNVWVLDGDEKVNSVAIYTADGQLVYDNIGGRFITASVLKGSTGNLLNSKRESGRFEYSGETANIHLSSPYNMVEAMVFVSATGIYENGTLKNVSIANPIADLPEKSVWQISSKTDLIQGGTVGTDSRATYTWSCIARTRDIVIKQGDKRFLIPGASYAIAGIVSIEPSRSIRGDSVSIKAKSGKNRGNMPSTI